jgi:hypothetical protein
MSTEINIKKRIDIQEEGVSITPDVNSINFTGDGVTASAIGDDVTVNIPGGMGTTTYYLNESVTQAPYKEFTSTLTASPEQTIVTSIASGATVTIQSFQTPSGVPGTTNIPGGRWAFYLHFSGTTGDSWDVFAEIYKRDLGGIETLLLTTDAVPTSTLTGAAVMLLSDGVFPASTVLTTDRIVVKVRVTNTDSTTNSITFHTEGNTNYSVATTTLNQVVPTGAVTSVTGTAPVVSSGGTTPAISMPAANGTTNGYLTSADWTTFNGKQNAITLTTTGTSGAATLVGSTLNVPQYGGGGLQGVHAILPLPNGLSTSYSITSHAATASALVANRMYTAPFIPAQTITSSNLYINCTTIVAGALARILIYSDLNGRPNTKLYESANLDLSTLGLKTANVTFNFVVGTTYWLTLHSSSTAQISHIPAANGVVIMYFNQTANNLIFDLVTFGSAPSPWSPTFFNTGVYPFIGITKA